MTLPLRRFSSRKSTDGSVVPRGHAARADTVLPKLPRDPKRRALVLLGHAIVAFEQWAAETERRVDSLAEANMMLARASDMVEQAKHLLLDASREGAKERAEQARRDRLDQDDDDPIRAFDLTDEETERVRLRVLRDAEPRAAE